MKKRNFSITKLFNKSFKIRLSKKRVIAFSLVELMISLIAISVIAAAFTPVISKRLKGGSSVGGGGGIKKECKYISDDCASCSSQGCLDCKKDCGSNTSKDVLTCSCIDCPNNCVTCRYKSFADRTKICLKCRNGFYLEAGVCTACPSNYTCDGINKYNPCSKRWANCSKCNATTCLECTGSGTSGWNIDQQICTNCGEHCTKCDNSGCIQCELGYEPNGAGECILMMDLVEHNGKKWSSKNAGDPRGPIIPDGIAVCTVGQACNTGGASGICWKGNTSNNDCNGSSGNGYSGCSRTVCNWAAANLICKHYGMSLPTANDIKSIGNANGQFLATQNLNMCYIASPDNPTNTALASKCADTDTTRTGCIGAASNTCNPQRIWGQSKDWGETNTYRTNVISGSPCNAYRNDCRAYRNDCRGYRNDICRGYRNDICRGYTSTCRGYQRNGYVTVCNAYNQVCNNYPQYCSTYPTYCSNSPTYCSSYPTYCSAYIYTYSWSASTLTHRYGGTATNTNEAFSVRCVK